MGGFLGGLFERKAANARLATSHAVSQSPSARSGGMFASGGTWDTDKALRDGYEKVLYVFRCIDAIASNQAPIPMYVRKGGVSEGTIEKNPELHTLLNVRPNDYESAAMFRYRLSTQLLLSRRGAFIEVVGNKQKPQSLHLIPPQSCEPVPDPEKFIKGFKVRGADYEEKMLKPDQVVWVKLKPHPTDPYAQMTPLVSAGMSAEMDYFARMFNRNFLQNDGRPGLLITVQGQVSPEDANELKRRFSGGPMAAGQTTVIEGEGLSVADLSASPRDVQWMEAIRASKEDLLLAFGVPESVLGNASGRTFDNADAEYELFWTHTMIPHCDAIAGSMDAFTGEKDDDRVIAYDYRQIDVLQRQERRKHEKLMTEFLNGLITWNEYREGTGKKTWNTLGARIAVLPSGIAIGENDQDQGGITKLPTVAQITGGQPPAGQLGSVAQQQYSYQGARQGAAEGQRNFENIMSARALMLAGKMHKPKQIEDKQDDSDVVEGEVVYPEHPYLELRAKVEAMVEGLMTGYDTRQAKVVTDRLDHAKVRKGTRHWEGAETKAVRKLDPYYVVEVDRWANDMRDDFDRVLRPIMQREMGRAARDMDSMGIIGRLHEEGVGYPQGKTALERLVGGNKIARDQMIDAAIAPVLDVVEQATRRQSQRIAEKIRRLDDEGKSLTEIKQEIDKMVGSRGSWRTGLGVSMTTAAVEGAKSAVYGKGGPHVTKTWWTESDEKVRASHWENEGEIKAAHEPFVVGSTAMMFPGDPLAPVEEVANCRCWLEWQTT